MSDELVMRARQSVLEHRCHYDRHMLAHTVHCAVCATRGRWQDAPKVRFFRESQRERHGDACFLSVCLTFFLAGVADFWQELQHNRK